MNENEILYGKVIRKLNEAGLGPTDPAVKAVLDKLSTQKDPQKLKKLLEDLLALDIDELKDRLDGKRKKIEDKLAEDKQKNQDELQRNKAEDKKIFECYNRSKELYKYTIPRTNF